MATPEINYESLKLNDEKKNELSIPSSAQLRI
jgi:hypothetical protein